MMDVFLACAGVVLAGSAGYEIDAQMLDPQMFGFPVRRRRQYALCYRKPRLRRLDSWKKQIR